MVNTMKPKTIPTEPDNSRALINGALDSFPESIYFLEKYELAVYGISWNEVLLLKTIEKTPGFTVSQLSDYMNTKPFVVSRMLAKLEKADFVSSENSQTDKRFYHQYLTEAGAEKLRAIDDFNYQLVSTQLNEMPKAHADLILSVIGHLGELLKLPKP